MIEHMVNQTMHILNLDVCIIASRYIFSIYSRTYSIMTTVCTFDVQ
jgi:hypothetical protein